MYNMGIDLCAFQAAVPQEPLDLFQLHPRLQQVRSNAVAQDMRSDGFLDSRS